MWRGDEMNAISDKFDLIIRLFSIINNLLYKSINYAYQG
jgi:hypothetical protein